MNHMGHCCTQCLTYKVLDYTVNAKDYKCEAKRLTPDPNTKCDICWNNMATFQVSYYPNDI